MYGSTTKLNVYVRAGSTPAFPTMIEMSIEEYKKVTGGKNKFGAKKTVCRQKHTHDSKKEATRCNELYVLKRGGVITRLKQQPKFVLLKGFWCQHEKIRPIVYRADFSYYEDGELVIEDVKGKRTEVYLLKKKMLLNQIKNKKRCKFIET